MRYPKSMQIIGQTVNVEILDKPLYQFHTCPNCESYRFPVSLNAKDKACPACGCAETRPVDNTYVLGQFVVRDNTIKNWHSDNPNLKQVCETSFVHETIEAIDSICDLKLRHTQITTLAAALYQAFSTGAVTFVDDTAASVPYANAA